MKVPSLPDMSGIDPTLSCRVYTQDADGTQRRMRNSAKVWQYIERGVNHLAGRHARLLFCQAFDNATRTACNSSPCFEMRWIDNVANERDRDIRVVSLARDSAAFDANSAAYVTTNAVGSGTITSYALDPAPTFPDHDSYAALRVSRGGAANAVVTEEIGIMNGLPIVDICAQTAYLTSLDDSLGHEFATPSGLDSGGWIVQGATENARATFHQLRMGYNRLMVSFLGVCEGNARTMLTGTNASAKGFWTNSDAFVNVLDQSITTRTASSPGVSCHGYKGGVGKSNGLGVQFYVQGMKGVDNAVGYVKIVGPAHRADNDTTITIGDETATWYTNATPVYLNTEVDYDDETTSRNKLDIQIKATNAGEEVSVFTLLGYSRQT